MYLQSYTPNIGVKATRGWCLKYIDDAGNAPNRTPNARTALNNELAAKRISTTEPPLNIWVVGFLDLQSGVYAADDHVFFMKNLGGGNYEIRDSETNSGTRSPYPNVTAILAWFGAYAPQYVGWSTHCDGREYVKKGDNMKNGQIDDSYRYAIRIVDSEVKGWDFKKVHDGYYDASEMKYWKGRMFQEFIEDAFNTSVKYRADKSKAFSYKPGEADKKLQSIKDALK